MSHRRNKRRNLGAGQSYIKTECSDWDGGVVISPANVCSMLHSAAFFSRETWKKRAEKGMGKTGCLYLCMSQNGRD